MNGGILLINWLTDFKRFLNPFIIKYWAFMYYIPITCKPVIYLGNETKVCNTAACGVLGVAIRQ